MNKNEDFRLFKLSRTLVTHLTQAFSQAPTAYRNSVCKEMRFRAEAVMRDIRAANRFEIGSKERITRQYRAKENLEQLRDELICFCKIAMTGLKVESSLRSNVDEVERVLDNWIESDKKREFAQKKWKLEKLSAALSETTVIVAAIKDNEDSLKDKISSIEDAITEGKSRIRILSQMKEEAQDDYDSCMRSLRTLQDSHGKDDSVFAAAEKEMIKIGLITRSKRKEDKAIENELRKRIRSENTVNPAIL